MTKKWSFAFKLAVVIIIFTIIYNEFIVYILNSWSWNKLKCKNEGSCVKILLVADPQLIGEKNEIFHLITPLSIWDSDRYLQKTYSRAVDHLSPDVIIFLGDLLDEGSIADLSQYNRYLRRFFSIFSTQNDITHIWLPGDNDIGGETDRVTNEKIKRFENTFLQSPIIDVKNIRFSKINRMIRTPPSYLNDFENNDQKVSVIVSHMPLVLVPGPFVEMVLKVLKPKVIFAAHEHKGKIVQTNIWQKFRKVDDISATNNQIYKYKLNEKSILELLVPTCSYRMGTYTIGYGAAIIEEDESLQYTILWSPKRFIYLKTYLLIPVLILVYFLIEYIFNKIFKPRYILIKKQNYPFKIIKNGV